MSKPKEESKEEPKEEPKERIKRQPKEKGIKTIKERVNFQKFKEIDV